MEPKNDAVDIKDEDLKEEDFSEEELADENTDWKQKALELKGIAKRRATQLSKAKAKLAEAKPPISEPKPQNKKDELKESGELDYGQKAYLKSSGINSDEFDFVKEAVAQSGKSLDALLESKWFQAELKERRDVKAVSAAIPTGQKRSSSGARDSVDYWIQKGELPPNAPENQQLRRDIVKAKRERAADTQKFTSNPIGNATTRILTP